MTIAGSIVGRKGCYLPGGSEDLDTGQYIRIKVGV